MKETPPPYDATALLPGGSPEPTGPAGRPRWRAWLRRLATPMLAGAVALLLVGGVVGYLLGSGGTTSTTAVSPVADGEFDPAYGFGPHGPGGFGHGHRGAIGTIDSVDGNTITLTTRNGRKITVTAADSVAVTVRTAGTLADLKPGQTILVSGQRGADGNITANRIAVGAAR